MVPKTIPFINLAVNEISEWFRLKGTAGERLKNLKLVFESTGNIVKSRKYATTIFSFPNVFNSLPQGHLTLYQATKLKVFADDKIDLSVWGFTPYQQYFSYVMATDHKSTFSWTFFFFFQPVLNQSIILHWQASRSAIPIILSAKGESRYFQF